MHEQTRLEPQSASVAQQQLPWKNPFGSSSSWCSLQTIDLRNNHLQGPLPRSLVNCFDIRLLNVGNNQIIETFPSWLGSLKFLMVLILRFNHFHGEIQEPKRGAVFRQLKVIDLSYSNFRGSLPSSYFQYWVGMANYHSDEGLVYYDDMMPGGQGLDQNHPKYVYSMTIVYRGVEREYSKILFDFTAVDLSSNSFSCEIPDSITVLNGLFLLNLSHNMLSGQLRPSLGNLRRLEALDLSWNNLTGGIPQQLTQIPSISIFNVSYNNLSGPIPKGNQFGSFPNSSYLGNSGLCGDPLSRKCASSGQFSPPSQKDEGPDAQFTVEWIV
ncbi:hypothetical protein SAY86_031664 [Trapa natans]|uniref:Uncharacterized protein n=1 Tax=Trapa natans TaxID=22666 RepID=A0AAN7R8I3_TRANT|nr:hypothetical protein SAY86_031664 [Trapa natans]